MEIPKPEGGCNDVYPMWIGETIYFLSDRNGDFNLFSYDTSSKEIKQLTQYDDFPIHQRQKPWFEDHLRAGGLPAHLRCGERFAVKD